MGKLLSYKGEISSLGLEVLWTNIKVVSSIHTRALEDKFSRKRCIGKGTTKYHAFLAL